MLIKYLLLNITKLNTPISFNYCKRLHFSSTVVVKLFFFLNRLFFDYYYNYDNFC